MDHEQKLFNAIKFLLADRVRHGDVETSPQAQKHLDNVNEFIDHVESFNKPIREATQHPQGSGGQAGAAPTADGTTGGQK